MHSTFTSLPYTETGSFSNIVSAYLAADETLRPFYKHEVSLEGLKKALDARKAFEVDRPLLVSELRSRYKGLTAAKQVTDNIDLLLQDNTFTVCTAHQPALFTGTLFFVYKILHTIKLAEKLRTEFPGHHFVPVFYMGCEDADLAELGHIYLSGDKIEWETNQTGAVGRMHTKGLDKIIARIQGELGIHPHGETLVALLKQCYDEGTDIQTGTLKLVNALFGEFGLVVLIPDSPAFKRSIIPIMEDELFNQTAAPIVDKSIDMISEHFKVQARPREINLFYLKEDLRERIERQDNCWRVVNTDIQFTAAELKTELHEHPERFSPNVILRGIFQETILPNLAFIGGGGELAYWLELSALFDHYKVPYPVLVLRNSFLIVEQKIKQLADKLSLTVSDLFKDETELVNEFVVKESDKKLVLAEEIAELDAYYTRLKKMAAEVDRSLEGHVTALETRARKPIRELEKKMLRAEKKRLEHRHRHIHYIKTHLFPNNNLQERVENFMPYYAKWGRSFIQTILNHSLTVEQEFVVLTID